MADLDPQGMQSPAGDHKHEPIGVQLPAILIPAGVLALIIGLILLMSWGLLIGFHTHPASPDASLSPLALLPHEAPPPRLQTSPPMDLADFRAKEDADLNRYAWIDKTAGRVQVPIERAKELFLKEKGQAAPNATPFPGASAPISTGGTGQ